MKRILSIFTLCASLLVLFAQASWAADDYSGTASYLMYEGETHVAGESVGVNGVDGTQVATLTFGFADEADYQSATKYGGVAGFSAYTKGNGVNGNADGQSGTCYIINPVYNGTITVGVMLNANKAFYILEDGTALANYNGITVDEKYYGTYTFNVKAGSTYKVTAAGTKLGFFGFTYQYSTSGEVVPVQTYTLTIGASPQNAGYVYPSGVQQYTSGTNVYVYTYSNSYSYKFKHWTANGIVVSTSSDFSYTMPAEDVQLLAVYEYDPESPPDPAADAGKKYTLTFVSEPTNAGSFSYDSGKYEVGRQMWLYPYNREGFVFDKWIIDGEEKMEQSFYFTMPDHDVVAKAFFHYDPSSPADPEQAKLQYKVILSTQPANAGSFNWNTETMVEAQQDCRIYAYPRSGYKFREWLQDGHSVSTDQSYSFKMPAEHLNLVAVFDYEPENPGNPNANYWDAEHGEVIVDEFRPEYLSSTIENIIGGYSNRDKVSMITVAGPMSQYDMGVANYYPNCTYLDLSRTTGVTRVPSWNYSDNKTLTTICLPASIEQIDYYAFYNCSSLSSISCHALTPPILGENVFEGVPSGLIVYVPAEAIAHYEAADGWKDFTLLPLSHQVRALEVNMPEGTDISLYKGMFLELVNTKSGQKFRYVITDRMTYTFNSLIRRTTYNLYLKNSQGDVLGEIDDIEIVDENRSVTFDALVVPRTLTLKVLTPAETDVTEQTAITWLDTKDTYLTKGNTLTSQLEGNKVKYRITLPQSLGMQYLLPADQEYEVQAENNIIFTLTPIPQTTIGGKVMDVKKGQPINGATVAISQMLNGLYSKSFTAKADRSGNWSQQVFVAPTDVTVSMTDYVSQSLSFDVPQEEIPTFELKDINGTAITLNMSYTSTDGDTQSYYSDYNNVTYTVKNETAKEAVTEYNVQYPQIVLLESLPEGTELIVTATSKNNKFLPVSGKATVDANDRATVALPIVQLGGIKATFAQTDNNSIVGILYNGEGRLVKKYDYANTALTISELTDGEYTLVTMANSLFFNSVAFISQFAEAGLREGVDYLKNKVTVQSGAYTTVHNPMIPFLDETKLYYTGNNTLYSVNKTQVTAGQYLTMRGQVDFKSAYVNSVSDVKLVFELAEGSSFVENSVMVGRTLSSYEVNGNTISIPVDANSEQVRFCVMPTEGGKFTSSAHVEFAYEGNMMQQPIGDVTYNVKDLSISVPELIARTQLPVRGVAVGKSEVEVYDNGKFMGKTTALANGNWAISCDLGTPANLSNHVVYANVKTPNGVEMQTESKSVIYDRNQIQPNSVNMSFFNGWMRKTISVNFDFVEGKTDVSDYMFYSGTDLTFVIDLSNNDPTIVNGVTLNVFTDRDEIVRINASYDQKSDRWVAVKRFEANNLPVNLSVSIDATVEAKPDEVTENVTKADYEDSAEKLKQTNSDIDTVLNELEAELNKETPDNNRIKELVTGYNDKFEDAIVDFVPRNKTVEYTPYNPTDDTFFTAWSAAANDEELATLVDNIETVDEGAYNKMLEDYTPDYHATIASHEVDGVIFPTVILDLNSAPANPEPGMFYIPEGTWRFDDTPADTGLKVTMSNDSGDHIIYDFTPVLTPTSSDDTQATAQLGRQLDDLADAYLNQWNLANGGTFGLDMLDMAYDVEREGYRITKAMVESVKNPDGTINSSLLKKLLARAKANHPRIEQIGKIKNGLRYGGAVIGGLFALKDGYDAYKACTTWDEILKMIEQLCKKESADTYKEKGKEYKSWIRNRKIIKTFGGVGTTAVGYFAAGCSWITGGLSLAVTGGCFGVNMGLSYWETQYNRTDQQHRAEIRRLVNKDPNCRPFPDDDPIPDPPFKDITPIHDPSGFVYEAVSSNRVQGVTATAYYKEMVEDMYGDLHENIVLWDAEEYAQQNPLFTDENGMYQWDVPQGLWQVKFEKEGYQTSYSEWLPVPPPQLEVNIPIVQMLQPSVMSAKAHAVGVDIEFDKYMDPETLNTGNILVTKNGNKVEGTIKLLNEEITYEGETQTYASKVRFVMPEGQDLLPTDAVHLTVRSFVQSYAGVPMEKDYSQDFDVELIVNSIAVDELVNVGYGNQRTITVAALPADAAKGKVLKVQSLSTIVATTNVEELTLDENGQAELIVTGELPGSTMLDFAVVNSDVKGNTIVNVKDVSQLVTIAPRASRVSGTQVYRGTKIQLTTETDNAVIYYTLDGSCPCEDTPGRLVYNPEQPIVIESDNVVIKALAVGQDLDESETVTFNYSLKKTALNYGLPEGWKWISHNIETAVPVSEFVEGTTVDRILAQRMETVKDPSWGFIGQLTELQPATGYKVHQTTAQEKRLEGVEYNAVENTIDIKVGWNWIGYPLNQVMTVDEALTYFTATTGDYIIGQDGFAEYDGTEWKGTLEGLKPGQGYLFKSATSASITFNTNIVSNAVSYVGKRNYLLNSPWAYDQYAYANMMPVTAELYVNGTKADSDEYIVGAFAGDECRGVGQWKDGRLLMSVYGDKNEEIHFVAANINSETYYDVTEKMGFRADNWGSWYAPVALTLGNETTGMKQTYNDLLITPLVARDHITVSAGGRHISQLTITNMNGVSVIDIKDLGTGGVVTIGSLMEGVYIATVKAEGNTYYKKIVKANK